MKFKLAEARRGLNHSKYFVELSVSEQEDVESRAKKFIKSHSTPVFDSRTFRPLNTTDMSLTELSNMDLIIFCLELNYAVMRLKYSGEENTFFAYDSTLYRRIIF